MDPKFLFLWGWGRMHICLLQPSFVKRLSFLRCTAFVPLSNQLVIYVWLCFWPFSSVPLIRLLLFANNQLLIVTF